MGVRSTWVRKLPCSKATPPLSAGPGPAMRQGTPDPHVETCVPSATPRPIVQASAPERYRVRFTIGQETNEKLRRLQALLRREIPDGDPGAIFDRALTVPFLEFHHIQPYALEGPATVANISLRCWRHNQHEAELLFGPHGRRPSVRGAPVLRLDPDRTEQNGTEQNNGLEAAG